MKDFLYSGHLTDHRVAFHYTVTTSVANDAILAHDLDPFSGHLLGRALTGGVLAAAGLARGQRINMHWKYTGVVRSVLVDAGRDGTVRGFISPRHLGDGGTAADLLGSSGLLNLVRTAGARILASSTTEAHLQDVVEDLVYAQSVSDQVETGACVLIGFEPDPERPVRLCQGFMLQAMPDTDLLCFEQYRQCLQSDEVRQLLGRGHDADNYFEHILKTITGEASPAVELEARSVPRFACPCSQEKMGAVVRTLPASDRADILTKGEVLRIRCEFCNALYEVTPAECQGFWESA